MRSKSGAGLAPHEIFIKGPQWPDPSLKTRNVAQGTYKGASWAKAISQTMSEGA